MNDFGFVCEGAPTPKARPRFSNVKNFVRVFSTEKNILAEKKIRAEAKIAMNLAENFEPVKVPVKMYVKFFMPIPKSFSKKKTADCLSGAIVPTPKPDLDNLLKLFLDAMNKTVYEDDSLVVEIVCSKVYSLTPCAVIYIKQYVAEKQH
jgi:Holliday junction resolvase RusA-like endonuclease